MDLHSYTPSELEALIANALKVKNDKELAESFVKQFIALPVDVKALIKDLPLFIQPVEPVKVEPVNECKSFVVRSRGGATLRTFHLYAGNFRICSGRNEWSTQQPTVILGPREYMYEAHGYTPNNLEKVAQAMQACALEGWHLRDMQEAIYCKKKEVATCNRTASELMKYEPSRYFLWFVKAAFIEHSERKGDSVAKALKGL